MRRILTVMMCAGLLVIIGYTQSNANIVDRVNLEQNITSKAQHILDTMFGEHQFAVTTQVKLGNESWSLKYTGKSKIKVTQGKKQSKYQTLPGYAPIKNLSVDPTAQVPYDSKVFKNPPRIKRIELEIIANKDISKRELKKAKKILKDILKLKESRGDKITFVAQVFPVTEKKSILDDFSDAESSKEKGLKKGEKYLIYVIALFVIIYGVFQLRKLKQADKHHKAALAASSGGGGGGASSDSSSMEDMMKLMASGGSGGDTKDTTMKVYFDFVSPANISNVIAIIKREKLTAQYVGIIASFLPKALAAKLLEIHSVQEQAGILSGLSSEKILDKELITKLEAKVKSRLECSVGGSTKIANMFDFLPNKNKKKILESLKQKPEEYKQIRSNIILFDDLQLLTKEEINRIITEANLDKLSAGLMDAEPKTKQQVQSSLTSAAADMVRQFEELKKSIITEEEINVGQRHVLEIMDRFDQDHTIELRKKIIASTGGAAPAKAAPAEPAPPKQKE